MPILSSQNHRKFSSSEVRKHGEFMTTGVENEPHAANNKIEVSAAAEEEYRLVFNNKDHSIPRRLESQMNFQQVLNEQSCTNNLDGMKSNTDNTPKNGGGGGNSTSNKVSNIKNSLRYALF